MNRRPFLSTTAAVALLVGCACASQTVTHRKAVMTTATAQVQQVTPLPDVIVKAPTKKIVAAAPIAFVVTREIGNVTHTYHYLFGPHPVSTEPARGWFINEVIVDDESGEEFDVVTFYLDFGFVYVTHTAVDEEGELVSSLDNAMTRPRVRTKRVLAQGEGTRMIVQAWNNTERAFAIEVASGYQVDVKGAMMIDQHEELDMDEYCVIDEDGEINNPVVIGDGSEPDQFVDSVMDIATAFGV